jgi:hypothetical protein
VFQPTEYPELEAEAVENAHSPYYTTLADLLDGYMAAEVRFEQVGAAVSRLQSTVGQRFTGAQDTDVNDWYQDERDGSWKRRNHYQDPQTNEWYPKAEYAHYSDQELEQLQELLLNQLKYGNEYVLYSFSPQTTPKVSDHKIFNTDLLTCVLFSPL